MAWLNSFLIVIQVICAASIIVLILLQHGKGADMGAAFGSGASGSLFGASGSANFLSRTTAVLAAIFFVTTIGMAYMATNARNAASRADRGGVMTTVGKGTAAPAAPGGPGDIPSGAPTPPAAPVTGASPAPSNGPTDIPK
jgi:preprotein translocase subunit SecG